MQTIIFMYYDIIIEKMIPGIFSVTNNKTEEGYFDSFHYIKDYIDNMNKASKKILNIKTFTTDFEIALYKTFNRVFNSENKIKHIGCYFHFLQNIRKYLQKNGLTSKKNIEIYNAILNICKSLPFKNLKYNALINYISKNCYIPKEILDDFLVYFKDQWLQYFNNENLKLNDINIKFRTINSLENFNRTFKYCFQKKSKINIIYYIEILIEKVIKHENFLIEENRKPLELISNNKLRGKNVEKEDNCKLLFYENISKEILEYDMKKNYEEVIMTEDDTDNNIENCSKGNNLEPRFLGWIENSCRYDTFFYIYCFSIKNEIKDVLKSYNNPKLNYIDRISDIFLSDKNDKILNEGIWKVFQKNNIPELDLISDNNSFKKYANILQPITFLKDIDLFCIKYHLYEGCSLCTIANEKTEYLTPNIEFTENDFRNNVKLEDIIKRKLTNVQSACPLCGYDRDKKIISQTYFKIYNKIELPKFIFVNFEFTEENEYEIDNRLEEERLCFNKRIKNNDGIIKFLLSEQKIFGKKYELKAIINTPQINHYNGIIINFNVSYYNLDLGNTYIYDGNKNSNLIIKVNNLANVLNINNPYIGLFLKVN